MHLQEAIQRLLRLMAQDSNQPKHKLLKRMPQMISVLQWMLPLSAILPRSGQYHTVSSLHKQAVHAGLPHAHEQAASCALQPQDNLIWSKQGKIALN
jgi:hypothetical protein